MTTLIQDLRYGLRMLAKNPGFTAVAVIPLALGIGANTAIFSVVNGTLLRPLPYKDPRQLVEIFSTNQIRHSNQMAISAADFSTIQRYARSFAQIALFNYSALNLTGQGEPAQLSALQVSPEFFPVLGVRPALGRWFLPEEGKPGRSQVVILAHALWQRRFGSDKEVLGKHITLNDKSYIVVGVMPPRFAFPERTEAWVPLDIGTKALESHNVHSSWDIARLSDGVTTKQAQVELDTSAKRLGANFPEDKDWGLLIVSLEEVVTGRVRILLWLLLGSVGLVLLIACLNVANLFLARGSGRMREIALRQAIGASPRRIVRQLLTESALVSGFGGLMGVLIGLAALSVLKALAPGDWQKIPRLEEASLDGWVLGFAIAAAFASVIISGLLPAVHVSGFDLNAALKEGGSSSRQGLGLDRGQRTRNLIVSLEVAFAAVLLVGCGLLLNSFWRLLTVNTGLDSRNVLTMSINLSQSKYSSPQSAWVFSQRVLERVKDLAGVKAAAFCNAAPYGDAMQVGFNIEGHTATISDQGLQAGFQIVSADYFRVLGMQLLKGRGFSNTDVEGRPGVAIVNQSFARQFFPNEDPIGKRIHIAWGGDPPPPQWEQIVGIVRDVRDVALSGEPWPEMYASYFQFYGGTNLLVRTESNPTRSAAAIRDQIWAVDKDQPVADTTTLDKAISASVAEDRFRTVLLSAFAGLALLLAIVGVYGVVTFTVNQRTHEIGIRMALGAEKSDVLKLVVGQGFRLTLIGVTIGIAGALGLTRFLSSLLYEVKPTDPLTFFVVFLILTGVALLASYIPARRATKVDPMAALRCE